MSWRCSTEFVQKIWPPPILDLSFRKKLREGPAVGEDEDLISTTFVNFQLQCNENYGVQDWWLKESGWEWRWWWGQRQGRKPTCGRWKSPRYEMAKKAEPKNRSCHPRIWDSTNPAGCLSVLVNFLSRTRAWSSLLPACDLFQTYSNILRWLELQRVGWGTWLHQPSKSYQKLQLLPTIWPPPWTGTNTNHNIEFKTMDFHRWTKWESYICYSIESIPKTPWE